MFRNHHNFKESSIQAGKPRWRNVFIALILALVIGSAGQTPTAHAAPADISFELFMRVDNPKKTVCVGETVIYEPHVYIPAFTSPAGTRVESVALPEIKVEAFSQNTTVGDFTNTINGKSVSRTNNMILDPANDELHPLTGLFPFKAKKAGNTTLYFEGLAYGEYVADKVEVKVINCKYKVQVSSHMSWSGPYGSIVFQGVVLNGLITADETGYIFTGTAAERWLSTSAVPNCGAVNVLGPGKVAMRGDLTETGQLKLNLTYDPVEFNDVVTCPSGSGGGSVKVYPSTLEVTVASSGGVVNRMQQMVGGPGAALGWALITITPVEAAK